jgi:hydrogenase-4 component E
MHALGLAGGEPAQVLAAAALLAGFAMLVQGRVRGVVQAYAAQSWAVALAALWQVLIRVAGRMPGSGAGTGWGPGWLPQASAGWTGTWLGAWDMAAGFLLATALLAAVCKGILVPWLLLRLLRRGRIDPVLPPARGAAFILAAGVALVALAVTAVLPTTPVAGAVPREGLALALSVALVGLLGTLGRLALAQAFGLLAMQNGLTLAMTGVPGLPATGAVELGGLVLVAALLTGAILAARPVQDRVA